MSLLQDWISSQKPVVLDGAMGTMLMAAGLESGDPPEEWNLSHPDRIRAVHRAYIQAGSQIFLTNSFGGTSFRLGMHGLENRVHELNRAAAQIARAEASVSDHPVLVAGSMGPTGQLFQPLGSMSFQDAVRAFQEQAAGLAEGGVDLFWIETMSDIQEIKVAVSGIREVSQLPITATMSFDTHGHTMMGVSPSQAVEELSSLDLIAIGANCGTGSDELITAIRAMRAASPGATLIAKANAGIPKVVEGEVVYNATPASMGQYAREVFEAGAQLIGGCCGNTPAHIQAMSEALEALS